MATFAQYAMVASEEALADSGWAPKEEEDLEVTVRATLPCACGIR
jgi:3-oxoacyl-[acyl-carrier-protein] synthase II